MFLILIVFYNYIMTIFEESHLRYPQKNRFSVTLGPFAPSSTEIVLIGLFHCENVSGTGVVSSHLWHGVASASCGGRQSAHCHCATSKTFASHKHSMLQVVKLTPEMYIPLTCKN